MYIAVDFDGTCVEHEYPEIGKDIGAVPVLKEIVANGHKLILHTMRSHPAPNNSSSIIYRDTLQEAIDWFKNNEIELFAANENPTQYRWTRSKKIFANLYIDDAALGAPLINGYIDWVKVREMLVELGIIK